jgi:serine/threonine protein kinase
MADAKADAKHEGLRGTLPPGTRLHNYELISVLGQGGFGITYYARDAALGREVAVKEYLPTSLALREATLVIPRSTQLAEDFIWGRERFLEEARILATLENAPAVVRVYDFLEANGTAYMVMALARGETLEERMRHEGRLPAKVVTHLFGRLLDGLEAVHETGFLHRDIKPGNIVLDDKNDPTLIDFGASRASIANRTTAMTTIFTPRYAAAEQLTSDKQGAWTDIYGLSATIYHAVTGQAPPSSLERALNDTCVPLAELAPAGFSMSFLRGLDAGLAVRSKDRPQSIGQWREILAETQDPTTDTTIVARPASRGADSGAARPPSRGPAVGAHSPSSEPARVAAAPAAAAEPAARSIVSLIAASLPPVAAYLADPRRRRLYLWAAAVLPALAAAYGAIAWLAAPAAVTSREAGTHRASVAASGQTTPQPPAAPAPTPKPEGTATGTATAAAAPPATALPAPAPAAAPVPPPPQPAAEAKRKAEADPGQPARAEAQPQVEAEAAVDARTAAPAAEAKPKDAAVAAADPKAGGAAQENRETVQPESIAAAATPASDAAKGAQPAAAADSGAGASPAVDSQADAAAQRVSDAAAEEQLTLSAVDRMRVQVALTSLGFDTGGADGIFGPRTRQMIRAWQAARGQPASGFLTAAGRQMLLNEATPALAKYDADQRRASEAAARAAAAPRPAASAPPARPAGVGVSCQDMSGRRIDVPNATSCPYGLSRIR